MGKITISGKALTGILNGFSYKWQSRTFDITTCAECGKLSDVLILQYKFSRGLDLITDSYCLCREHYQKWLEGVL